MIENEILKKKVKKVIEEVLITYEEEFIEKFSEIELKDGLKHKAKISKLGVDDDQLINLIKEEVEDILGVYLLQKSLKRKK